MKPNKITLEQSLLQDIFDYKDVKKWQASIWISGKQKYLGLFHNEQDARNAYLSQCVIHHQGLSL